MVVIDFEKKIKGDCTVKGHENWINLQSLELGVGRAISASGSGKDRDTSTPSFSELTMSKGTDISSTELFAQAIYGKKICDKAVVHFLQTGGAGADQIYMEIEIYEPIISSYSVSSGGERPSESVSVNFTKVVVKYSQFTEGGKTTKADPKGYDLMAGAPFAG